MGELRFKFPHASDIDPRVWSTAYITGIEGIPWKCRHRLEGDQFSIGREIDESGKLNILWPTRVAGNLCLSTTSLRVSESVYSLPTEVARGTLSRLKSQTADWQRVGLKLPEGFFPLAEQALNCLLRAITAKQDANSEIEFAQKAIDLAVESSILLCTAFANQALEARRQSEGRLATFLGLSLPANASLEQASGVANAFNMIQIGPDLGSVERSSGRPDFSVFDAQVAWALRQEKKICIGPMVNFRQGCLPKWMVLLEQNFDSVLDAACAHARAVVERYQGRVHIWNCAAGLNSPTEMGWTDEEVLRMAVSIIETVRRLDKHTPVLLSIDQPWSEYLRDDANGISPLHFADALIRADLGLSGLALELNFDDWPNGSFPRDPLEISRLIDRWAMLGLPLMAIVTSPTDAQLPIPDSRISNWRTGDFVSGVVSPDMIVRLLLSKPSIHAVAWDQLSDQDPMAAAGSGLLDSQFKAKALLTQLTSLRKNFLH